MPEPALRDVPVPPELSDLQAQLAMDAVIEEMANPGGLNFDETVDDPLTQYKANLREELAQEPQDLGTQFAAKEIMDREYVVPPAETAPTPEEPPPVLDPELVQLNPSEGPLAGGTGVQLIGGPFDDTCEVVWDGQPVLTVLQTESALSCDSPPATVQEGDTQVPVFVRRTGDAFETTSLSFTYKADIPAPPPPEPAQGTGTPLVEGA